MSRFDGLSAKTKKIIFTPLESHIGDCAAQNKTTIETT